MPGRATMNISLPPALRKWVDRQVATRGFGTSSEFVRHLLREAWEQEQGYDPELERELLKGLDSGPATPMTKADWNRIKHEIRRRDAERSKHRKSA